MEQKPTWNTDVQPHDRTMMDGKLILPTVINLVCRMCESEVYKNDDGQLVCVKCGYVQ